MSTPRGIRLSPEELALKLAFREAVTAAGGQPFVAGEVGRAQSRVSDWCSPDTPDFAPIDVVRKVEALGAGAAGHPHVTRALARAQGFALTGGGAATHAVAMDDLGAWLAAVAREGADLATALAEQNLAEGCEQLPSTARARVGREARQLIDVLERLCRTLDGAAPPPGDAAGAASGVVDFRRSDSS